MELKPGTLKHFQEYINHHTTKRGFDDETIEERLIILTEEIGELMNAYRHESGMYVDEKAKQRGEIGEEIADVLIMTIAVASALGVDVEQAFLTKEQKNHKRTHVRR